MGAVVQLAASRAVTEEEVARAFAVVRALNLAEVTSPSLTEDESHMAAREEAQAKFRQLFEEWMSS